MNTFNKLYNLILQSIITQNRAERIAKLKKCDWLYYFQQDYWIMELDRLNNNKLADFLCKFIINKELTNEKDERINIVKKILQINPSVDTQNYKGSLNQFIQKYTPSLNKHQQKIAVKTNSFLDKISQFSQKKEYPNGVVIYRVQEDEDGMKAVRKIVDLQWGKDANPWCLIARRNGDMEDAWSMWRRYSAFPKHIAFQNGQLIAFCADSSSDCTWWDRGDHSTRKLKLLDGSYMSTDHYEWPEDYKDEQFFENHTNLKYNNKTGMYDVQGNIELTDVDMINGHVPVKLGVVTGNFDIDAFDCNSLQNCPEEVHGNVYLHGNYLSLKGCPQKIDGNLVISNTTIRSLEGCPKKVKGFILRVNYIHNLTDGPKEVETYMSIESFALESLDGCPEKINGDFKIQHGHIKTLIGGPKYVSGEYSLFDCKDFCIIF